MTAEPAAQDFAQHVARAMFVANDENEIRRISTPKMLAMSSHARFLNVTERFRANCGHPGAFRVTFSRESYGFSIFKPHFDSVAQVLLKANCGPEQPIYVTVATIDSGSGWMLRDVGVSYNY